MKEDVRDVALHYHREEQVAWKVSLVAWLEFSSRKIKNAGIQKKKMVQA